MRAWLVPSLLLVALLSGCLGGADDPATPLEETETEEPAEPVATETTGSIQGQVVNVDYEPIAAASVILLAAQGNELIAEVFTNSRGRYTMNDVPPGDYRIHFVAACCVDHTERLTVRAGEVTTRDIVLNPIVIPVAHVEPLIWEGNMACGFAVAGEPVNCHESLDPNHNTIHTFDAPTGLMSIIIAVEWTTVPTHPADRLRFRVYYDGERSGGDEGPSHLEYRTDWPGGTAADMEVKIWVQPAGTANVVYQQPFTVHYHLFYGLPAPDDYVVLQDG